MNNRERTIMMIDCQSFYASVEKAAHPEYRNRAVVVAADPARRSGIILAACPIAKRLGVRATGTVGEALAKCPELLVIRPRMQTYIDVSLHLTELFESYTDLVEPYSIDEQFLDVTQSLSYFGSAEEVARQLQVKIQLLSGVWARVGISSTKVLAKMATDLWAKKSEEGIFTLRASEVPELLWPRPVNDLFGVGSRMTAHLHRIGVYYIGDIARMPLGDFKQKLRQTMGKQADIQAELYWQTARGIDPSPVMPSTHHTQQAVGHQMTLPRDYSSREEIDVVLLELTDEVCRRSRGKGYMGRVVATGARGSYHFEHSGFYRQATLPDPTNITAEVYHAVKNLFYAHWDGLPVRRMGVTLTGLMPDDCYQLTMFGNRERTLALEKTADQVKHRFGCMSLIRASSLLEFAQARERSMKIGGHYL